MKRQLPQRHAAVAGGVVRAAPAVALIRVERLRQRVRVVHLLRAALAAVHLAHPARRAEDLQVLPPRQR